MGAGASCGIAAAVECVSIEEIKLATSGLNAETRAKLLACIADAKVENGHAVLAEKIAADKTVWAMMAAKTVAPSMGASFAIAMVADQDQASRRDGCWESMLAYGTLTYKGDMGDASYSLEITSETLITTTRSDDAARGAEYSALEVFDGKLLTFCDRTGNVDEFVPKGIKPEDGFEAKPLMNADGEPVRLKLGDATKDKALKTEWSTQKGGRLVVGSTGKARTDDESRVVHHGEMWVKTIEPKTFAVVDIDGTASFNGLGAAARVCPAPAKGEVSQGYIIHESGRWSDEHSKWFFLPRKLSREPYEESKDTEKCINLMLAAPETVSDCGSGIIIQPYLEFLELRGCSDFVFIPGTRDGHLLVMRTEESEDGVMTTFSSVIGIDGQVLMKEAVIKQGRKFEGVAWVGGFGPFQGVLAEQSKPGECTVS